MLTPCTTATAVSINMAVIIRMETIFFVRISAPFPLVVNKRGRLRCHSLPPFFHWYRDLCATVTGTADVL